jgi:hypothetical protein
MAITRAKDRLIIPTQYKVTDELIARFKELVAEKCFDIID